MKRNESAVTGLVDELNELKLFNMSAALEDIYNSPEFENLDRLSLIGKLIDAEYDVKISKRYKNRLKRASLTGNPQVIESCRDSKERDYTAFQKRIRYLVKLDLLILDDFLFHTITNENEVKVLFELIEKRTESSKSTIVCSQREPSSWASMIMNDEVSSNAIMKRVTKHYTVVIQPKS